MAVAFIASAVGSNDSATCAKPSGTLDGHIMIAVINQANLTDTPALAGWNLIEFSPDNATAIATTLLYKVASGEGASYTFTATTPRKTAILTFSGQDGSNPILGSNKNFTSGASTTTITPGSVTINEADCASVLGMHSANTTAAWTQPGGWNETTSGDARGGASAYQVFGAAPGATNPTLTCSASAQLVAAQAVIRPTVVSALVPRLALLGVG